MNEKDFEKLKNNIKPFLSTDRYNHSISVAITASNLSFIHNENIDNAITAGIYHDIAKELKLEEMLNIAKENNIKLSNEDIESPKVLHGIIGAKIIQNNFDITNDDILNSVKNHTLGRPKMSKLEKIIYISDYIEPLRESIPNIEEIRKRAYINLNETVYLITKNVIDYLNSKNINIHTNTILTNEYYKYI